MQAIRFTQPLTMEHVDVPEPGAPGPGQALVRTHRMGVCGTDVGGYLGKMPFFSYPRIPGHELGVEVLEVGPGVDRVRPGDRCSVEPYMNCGQCFACRRGQGNCCERLQVIGVMVDGGLCERFLIRSDKLHPSSALDYEQLALVETLAIGCHAVDRGAPRAGAQALIIGAGPIGLAVLEFTRLTGAEITVMDLSVERLEFCRRRYNVAHTLQAQGNEADLQRALEITRGDRFELVTDATGNHRSMSAALQFVAHSGTLVYVGITTSEIAFPHPALHKPEMTLKASRNALPADFPRIMDLIEQGVIDTGPWITHRTPFVAAPVEFPAFTRPETGVIKAMIEVP
jgi:alcohol dehydrogenase